MSHPVPRICSLGHHIMSENEVAYQVSSACIFFSHKTIECRRQISKENLTIFLVLRSTPFLHKRWYFSETKSTCAISLWLRSFCWNVFRVQIVVVVSLPYHVLLPCGIMSFFRVQIVPWIVPYLCSDLLAWRWSKYSILNLMLFLSDNIQFNNTRNVALLLCL